MNEKEWAEKIQQLYIKHLQKCEEKHEKPLSFFQFILKSCETKNEK